MIGNLVALYPLRLFDARDPRIVDTIAALKEIAWMEDAYFNHVGHSAFGTYLSLHVAQCLLFQRNADAWKTINWVLRHASPTFTWAEGIHPITRRGGMGDGHHGWALADFLLAVRNALLFEEDDHLVITPALPEDWTAEMNVHQSRRRADVFRQSEFHDCVRRTQRDARRQRRLARCTRVHRMESAIRAARGGWRCRRR